jgi:metallophosphoesterase superfamily enzyme
MNPNIPIHIAGASLLPDLYGALLWPEESTLIVADLHLEKGSSYAERRRPQFLPPYDTRTTIGRLENLMARHAPSRVICLGDSVHDRGAEARMEADDAARIAALTFRNRRAAGAERCCARLRSGR